MFRRISVHFMFDMTEIISTEFVQLFHYGLQFDGQFFIFVHSIEPSCTRGTIRSIYFIER